MASQFPLLFPAGPVAQGELDVIIVTLVLSASIVVPVFVLLFYFARKYRAGGPAAETMHAPDWDHDSKLVEFSWWLAPTLVIVMLGVLMWYSARALDPYKPLPGKAITVEVIALDWKWLFIYPDYHIATVNKLVIPEGEPVHLLLTADAPMNSFWIPQLAGQIMVMPGMQTQLYLEADTTGTFNGMSANISGQGFSGMAFTADAVSPGDFANWVDSVTFATTSRPLTVDSYVSLAKPTENMPPAYFAPVDSHLYTALLQKYMTSGKTGAVLGM